MKKPFEAVSLTTLEETPKRVVEFLRGVGASFEVMQALAGAGYTRESHEEGIRLLQAVIRLGHPSPAVPDPTVPVFGAALKELKTWVKTDFRRIRMALARAYSAQAEFLFDGLEISGAMDAVALVDLFLERYAALEEGPERKATRKKDHAAVAMIEARGVTKKNIERLRELVSEAHAIAAVPPADSDRAETDARMEALAALRAWYADWAESARVVLTRRDHLIRVGLATRKPRGAVAVVVHAFTQAPPATMALPMTTEASQGD